MNRKDITHVVVSFTERVGGDELESGVLPVVADPTGDPQVLDAPVALSGDVEVHRRERLVEVMGVVAQPDVDVERLPGMVRLESKGAALKRPLGSVVVLGGVAGACLLVRC